MNNARPGPAGPPRPDSKMREVEIVDLTSDSDDDFEDAPERPVSEPRWDEKASPLARPQPEASPVALEPPDVEFNQGRRDPVAALDMLDEWDRPDQGQVFDDESYARALQEQFAFEASAPGLGFQPHLAPSEGSVAPIVNANIALESLPECINTLETVFPDICNDHVSDLYNTVSQSSERLIDHILTKGPYPRAKDKQKALKRKRELDLDEEAARKYSAVDRVIPEKHGGIRPYIRTILGSEFPSVSYAFIESTLSGCGHRLFSAYRVISEALRTYTSEQPTCQKIKTARKKEPTLTDQAVESYLANPNGDQERVEILKELQTARRIDRKEEARHQAELEAQRLEEENTQRAIAEGAIAECACCYGDFPLNRLVHCNGDVQHQFCRDCARRNAETEIGKSRFELNCMSMDSCTGGFDLDQRIRFLDEATQVALDRNEQEANLRLAGIENLASCPFCPYAAEYPPVEVDREFRCQAPDCEKISCRLCKEESHIPKSCEEAAKEKGLSIRRQIEEAMSAALIRKCNKCGTPFVKEEGCNKMTCTRNGCYNIQCYVCSKSCDYQHFNDPNRGGKQGNCPLFESVEDRHQEEVSKAEREALQKLLADHPEYTEEDLKVKMSENVMKDDERRKAASVRGAPPHPDPLRAQEFAAQRLVRRQNLLRRLDAVPPPPPLPANNEAPPAVFPDPFEEFMDFEADPLRLLEEPLGPPHRELEALRGRAAQFAGRQNDPLPRPEPAYGTDPQSFARLLAEIDNRPPWAPQVLNQARALPPPPKFRDIPNQNDPLRDLLDFNGNPPLRDPTLEEPLRFGPIAHADGILDPAHPRHILRRRMDELRLQMEQRMYVPAVEAARPADIQAPAPLQAGVSANRTIGQLRDIEAAMSQKLRELEQRQSKQRPAALKRRGLKKEASALDEEDIPNLQARFEVPLRRRPRRQQALENAVPTGMEHLPPVDDQLDAPGQYREQVDKDPKADRAQTARGQMREILKRRPVKSMLEHGRLAAAFQDEDMPLQPKAYPMNDPAMLANPPVPIAPPDMGQNALGGRARGPGEVRKQSGKPFSVEDRPFMKYVSEEAMPQRLGYPNIQMPEVGRDVDGEAIRPHNRLAKIMREGAAIRETHKQAELNRNLRHHVERSFQRNQQQAGLQAQQAEDDKSAAGILQALARIDNNVLPLGIADRAGQNIQPNRKPAGVKPEPAEDNDAHLEVFEAFNYIEPLAAEPDLPRQKLQPQPQERNSYVEIDEVETDSERSLSYSISDDDDEL